MNPKWKTLEEIVPLMQTKIEEGAQQPIFSLIGNTVPKSDIIDVGYVVSIHTFREGWMSSKETLTENDPIVNLSSKRLKAILKHSYWFASLATRLCIPKMLRLRQLRRAMLKEETDKIVLVGQLALKPSRTGGWTVVGLAKDDGCFVPIESVIKLIRVARDAYANRSLGCDPQPFTKMDVVFINQRLLIKPYCSSTQFPTDVQLKEKKDDVIKPT